MPSPFGPFYFQSPRVRAVYWVGRWRKRVNGFALATILSSALVGLISLRWKELGGVPIRTIASVLWTVAQLAVTVLIGTAIYSRVRRDHAQSLLEQWRCPHCAYQLYHDTHQWTICCPECGKWYFEAV